MTVIVKDSGNVEVDTRYISPEDIISKIETVSFYTHKDVSAKYHAVADSTLSKDATLNRMWRVPETSVFLDTAAQGVVPIPEGFNAIQVFMSALCTPGVEMDSVVAEGDAVLIFGCVQLMPEATSVGITSIIGSKQLYDSNGINPRTSVYRDVVLETVPYREVFFSPFILGTQGHNFVLPVYAGTVIQDWATPANMLKIRMWAVPVVIPYQREGL